jgi:selenocysteine-specific elongation factor
MTAIIVLLGQWHQDNPLRPGMPREEVRGKVLPGVNSRVFAALLDVLLPGAGVELRGQDLALNSHQVELSQQQQQVQEKILAALVSNPFSPPDRTELEALDRGAPAVIKLLASRNEIVMAGDIFFSRQAVDEAVTRIRGHFAKEGQLTLAQFRDYLNTSRKYALPLMEFLDGSGYTRRRGDVRLPGPALRR